MTNYEYMAIAKKLMEKDDRKNLITGLMITVIAISGVVFLQYQLIKAKRRQIAELDNRINNIQEQNIRHGHIIGRFASENSRQKREINQLEESNQSMANQLIENLKQTTKA